MTQTNQQKTSSLLLCKSPEMTVNYSNKLPMGGGSDNNSGGEIEQKQVTLQENNNQKLPLWIIIYPITCPYYTQKYHLYHRGVDLINKNCNGNINVFAVSDGIVSFQGEFGLYGNRVEINHGNGFISTYSHLKIINVKVGQEIKMGSELGVMGTTGKTTGLHLHFELLFYGVKINPDLYLK